MFSLDVVMIETVEKSDPDRELDYTEPSWRAFSILYNTPTIVASVLLLWAAVPDSITPRWLAKDTLFCDLYRLLLTPVFFMWLAGVVCIVRSRRARYSPFFWLSVLLSFSALALFFFSTGYSSFPQATDIARGSMRRAV